VCHFAGQSREQLMTTTETTIVSRQACQTSEEPFIGTSHACDPSNYAETVHDFRNILNLISLLSQLVLRVLPDVSPVYATVWQIKVASADASELCDRMMKPPNRENVDIECVDLSTLVLGMAPQLTTFLPIVSSLHFDLVDKSPLKVTSSCEIRQVIMNLVKNAAESLDDRPGSVTVSTGLIELDDVSLDRTLIRSRATRRKYSYLGVSDTGCGMDDSTRSRLFEESFTTKSRGHGLGTASIRRIVQNNGGIIQVNSQPGNGTQIRVLFPLETGISITDCD
jgi:two-component system cell cycle sensor histidine kinase/response regulator CckA